MSTNKRSCQLISCKVSKDLKNIQEMCSRNSDAPIFSLLSQNKKFPMDKQTNGMGKSKCCPPSPLLEWGHGNKSYITVSFYTKLFPIYIHCEMTQDVIS